MGSFQEFLQYQASAVEGFARAFLPRVPLTGTGVRVASHWVKFRGFGRLQASRWTWGFLHFGMFRILGSGPGRGELGIFPETHCA